MRKTKILFEIFIIMSVLVLWFSISANAESNNESDETSTMKYSKAYLEWCELSDEEKENTLMPRLYDIEYNPNSTLFKSNNLVRTMQKSIISNMEYYNLAEDININVKDQGYTNECWAFATTSVIETTFEKTTGMESDTYSPKHLDYLTSSDIKSDNNFIRSLGGRQFLLCFNCVFNEWIRPSIRI